MEVYYNGEWGTVCDDEWDLNDARVVCRQLGFRPPIAALEYSHYGEMKYGEGSGEIWLDNVECVGNELIIQNCVHNGWGNENCHHDEDVGVKCGNNGM